MTICLRPKSGLRMNLRVLSVTGCSRSAILSILLSTVVGRWSICRSVTGVEIEFGSQKFVVAWVGYSKLVACVSVGAGVGYHWLG